MIALNTASSSANEVSIRHATSGCFERISRQTSTPSPSGSRTSRTATSGVAAGMRSYASSRGAGLADDLEVALAPRAARAHRAARPRGRRGGTPARSSAHSAWRRRGVHALVVSTHVRGGRAAQPARAPRRRARPRLGSRPPSHAPTDRRGGGRARRCPLWRARRARRDRHAAGAVHHGRHRRRHARAHR